MASAPKMIMKAVKSVLVLLLVAGLLYGGLIVNQKRQEAVSDLKQEALDEMAQTVDSFETALLQNKEAVIAARNIDWRDALAAWCKILATVEPEDLKLLNDEGLKRVGWQYRITDVDSDSEDEGSVYQYEAQRVDLWGTPYRIVVVVPPFAEGPIETDVMIWSAGPNKEFFYAPAYMDGKPVPDNPRVARTTVEPDDVCYTIVADKDFRFEYFGYKEKRSDNTSIEDFRPRAQSPIQ